jgi:hypothetical protein
MSDKNTIPEDWGGPDTEGASLTVRLSPLLQRYLAEKSRSLGISPEECAVLSLAGELSPEGRFEPMISEIRKMVEKNDRIFLGLREELDEINGKNRGAYESLLASLKPDRKEWGMILGAGALLAVLLVVALVFFGRNIPGSATSPGEVRNAQTALPAQMSPKDRYTYFVGSWYMGVRDRMSTKERLYIENYLKPFDNFDEDQKYRKKAGL